MLGQLHNRTLKVNQTTTQAKGTVWTIHQDFNIQLLRKCSRVLSSIVLKYGFAMSLWPDGLGDCIYNIRMLFYADDIIDLEQLFRHMSELLTGFDMMKM